MADEQPVKSKKSFYNYKVFVIFSVVFLLVCIGILANSALTTGDMFKKGIELKGGTTVIINLPQQADINKFQSVLKAKYPDITVREIRGISGYEISIEGPDSLDTKGVIAEVSALGLSTEKTSVRSVGAALGASFFQQVQVGILVSFALMGIVVFLMFRTFAPSVAVIAAAATDIIETLAFMQLFGIELTLSTFAALLMLIGYSVDTDILLTTRVLRGSSNMTVSERVKGAFKTGMTMTFTTIGALSVLFISNISPVLTQISSVLLIGLVLDTVNTWIQNVAIIRSYAEKKGM